ncbi:MAG: hypothetical protein QOE83_171 [Actinomycetota bacterium]|nr:hypothetical protein [Actinomycetota bacterium]
MEKPKTPSELRGLHRETLFTAALIGLRLFVLVLWLVEVRRGNAGGPDVFRFHTLARQGGTPWRDYRVEYAPLEVLLIKGLFGGGILSAAVRLAVLEIVADLATWGAVRTGWGRRGGLFYLAVGLPILILELKRIDLVPVAFAMWAFVLLRRARPGPAGVTLGLAVLMKVWPLVILPGLWLRGRARALWSFVAVVASGALGWIVWGGFGAPSQVLTFRGARGWEVGSTVGSLVWVIGGGGVREEAGAGRVGTAPGWAKFVLGLVLLGVLICVWRRAARRQEDVAGAPAFTAVAALLLLSPLFSAQYVMWLLPWAAVAAIDDDHPAVLLTGTFIVCAASAVIGTFLYNSPSDPAVKVASVARLVVLTALVIRGLTAGTSQTSPVAPGLSTAG